MTDALTKALSENHEAVVYALDATQLIQESMERLNSWPPATKHLGQAMMSAILLQALTEAEDNETVSLQWMCEGPFGHVFAEARNYGEVRGTIQHPRANVQDYETNLGEGILQVRRAKGSVFGTTSIVNSVGVVSTDLVEYLEKSEQRNCGVNLMVHIDWEDESKTKFRVRSALAYLIHILPQPTEQKTNDALVRWDRQMRTLGSMQKWLLREDQITLDMLRLITGEENPKIVMNQRVKFHCNCSEERAARALALLEVQEEKEGSFQPTEETEIRCEYCGRNYTISAGKTDSWKQKAKTPRAPYSKTKPAKKGKKQ